MANNENITSSISTFRSLLNKSTDIAFENSEFASFKNNQSKKQTTTQLHRNQTNHLLRDNSNQQQIENLKNRIVVLEQQVAHLKNASMEDRQMLQEILGFVRKQGYQRNINSFGTHDGLSMLPMKSESSSSVDMSSYYEFPKTFHDEQDFTPSPAKLFSNPTKFQQSRQTLSDQETVQLINDAKKDFTELDRGLDRSFHRLQRYSLSGFSNDL